ncbi:MAG: hypothetical protein ACRC7O_07210 [Fimbriiglobus sp.]
MTVTLTKVDGGFQLVIPDDLAAKAGLAAGLPVVLSAVAEMVMIHQPEFVAAAREAMFARITPENLPGNEPYIPVEVLVRAGA